MFIVALLSPCMTSTSGLNPSLTVAVVEPFLSVISMVAVSPVLTTVAVGLYPSRPSVPTALNSVFSPPTTQYPSSDMVGASPVATTPVLTPSMYQYPSTMVTTLPDSPLSPLGIYMVIFISLGFIGSICASVTLGSPSIDCASVCLIMVPSAETLVSYGFPLLSYTYHVLVALLIYGF